MWDTSLAVNALIESDLPPDHPALVRAAEWMMAKQVAAARRLAGEAARTCSPAAGRSSTTTTYYPDLDDTAMVLMALEKVQGVDADRTRTAKERGLGWFLGMQGQDGGWASFDADNNRLYLNNIPFADHGALLDPSTEDLTGRGLELLGTLGYGLDFEPADRALDFIRHSQRHDGPWYGRWGVNYIYGTWSVLRGLAAIGVDPRHEFVQRAVRWLERRQNADGGWGETCESYDQARAGRARATRFRARPRGRCSACSPPAARRARRRARHRTTCCARSSADGSWEDALWNGTGFPRVFYLKYHLYAKYFPLWALGVYRRAHA